MTNRHADATKITVPIDTVTIMISLLFVLLPEPFPACQK